MSRSCHVGPTLVIKQQRRDTQKSPNTGCAGRLCETTAGVLGHGVIDCIAYPHMGVLDQAANWGRVLVNGGLDSANLPPYVGFTVDDRPDWCIWCQITVEKKHYRNIMTIVTVKR